jgi:saccharopine dehydrogenase-like NADP-dependent oxidoreductase
MPTTLLKRRIVVLCGYGPFSRRVAAGIAAMADAECVLGLPPGARAASFSQEIGAPFMVVDPNDPASLSRLLDGAFAVVNVHGPFMGREHLGVAARCAALGVHYVDPSESRDYTAEFMRLARDARDHDALLVTGAGAAPAITSALVELFSEEFDRINEIHVFITPGFGDQRELATARAVLEYTRAPVRIKEHGRTRERAWWEQPLTVAFPHPLGARRGYLCDLSDLDSLDKQFDPKTVTVRAGFAPGVLSGAISFLAFLRRRHWLKNLSPFSAMLVRAAARVSSAGTDAAGVRVDIRGVRRSTDEAHVAALIGRDGAGPAIAAAPVLALIRRWLAKGVDQTGAAVAAGMLHFDDIKPELSDCSVVLVRQ